MRKQQRKRFRLIAVPLAQPALQLGALQQQLIAAWKWGLCRCSIGLLCAEVLSSLLAAHERKVDKKEVMLRTKLLACVAGHAVAAGGTP
jgi:hypothetical protein